jgi:uncharacterized protein YggU (UPF0235/DUF167 family)
MLLQVKVKPNARASVLTPAGDGTWLARLRSPPAEGRANEELIALVAGHFGVARSSVSIRGGASGRTKYLSVPDSATPPPKE